MARAMELVGKSFLVVSQLHDVIQCYRRHLVVVGVPCQSSSSIQHAVPVCMGADCLHPARCMVPKPWGMQPEILFF